MNIHYFRDGYCHHARCRNINSARFAAAVRGKVAKERRRRERKSGRKGRWAQYPTLFHFTVDPVASFRSLELDLIKIRAGEALTPPIKSPNHSPVPRPPSPPPLGENRHSARERYPASIGRGRVYKGGTFRADLTDLPQINRTPVSRGVCDKNEESRLLNYSGKL